jgi:hypothetical protein
MARIAPLLGVALAALVLAPAASAFRSPTGNIGCAIESGGVRCDIRDRSWRPPPKPRSCDVDFGQGLSVGRSGRGRFVCAGDTALFVGGKVPYGTLVRRGRFACRVRTSGVRCLNTRNRHGFALSRQGYRRF